MILREQSRQVVLQLLQSAEVVLERVPENAEAELRQVGGQAVEAVLVQPHAVQHDTRPQRVEMEAPPDLGPRGQAVTEFDCGVVEGGVGGVDFLAGLVEPAGRTRQGERTVLDLLRQGATPAALRDGDGLLLVGQLEPVEVGAHLGTEPVEEGRQRQHGVAGLLQLVVRLAA
jgi:hypothetical protein